MPLRHNPVNPDLQTQFSSPLSCPIQAQTKFGSPQHQLSSSMKMALLQAMSKTPGMNKNLKHSFISNIKIRTHNGGCTKVRVLFDQYLPLSLEEKTRTKRSTSNEASSNEVHDEMSIKTVSLRNLLSCSKIKGQLAMLLAKGLLEEFKGKDLRLIVSYDTNIRINTPHRPEEDFLTQEHEEDDSQITFHVLHFIKDCVYKHIVVSSPDTDVLVLLIDLVAHGRLGSLTTLKFHTGKGNKFRKIDVGTVCNK